MNIAFAVVDSSKKWVLPLRVNIDSSNGLLASAFKLFANIIYKSTSLCIKYRKSFYLFAFWSLCGSQRHPAVVEWVLPLRVNIDPLVMASWLCLQALCQYQHQGPHFRQLVQVSSYLKHKWKERNDWILPHTALILQGQYSILLDGDTWGILSEISEDNYSQQKARLNTLERADRNTMLLQVLVGANKQRHWCTNPSDFLCWQKLPGWKSWWMQLGVFNINLHQ